MLLSDENTRKRGYQDRFLWISIILPIIVFILFEIQLSFHPESDFEMALIQILLYILWLFIIGIRVICALWCKLWPKNLISLALSLACLWFTPVAFHRWFPVGPYIHLMAVYPAYEKIIKASPPDTRLKFDWGGGGWVTGPSFNRTLVYDPSDNLPKENRIKDAERRARSRYTRGKEEYFHYWLETWHLFSHFYLVEEWQA